MLYANDYKHVDDYKRSYGGSAAYLIVSRVLYDSAESYSLRDIQRLTGLSLTTTHRTMPYLSSVIRKNIDGRYFRYDLYKAPEHGEWDEAEADKRKAARIKSRHRDGTHTKSGEFIPVDLRPVRSVRGTAPFHKPTPAPILPPAETKSTAIRVVSPEGLIPKDPWINEWPCIVEDLLREAESVIQDEPPVLRDTSPHGVAMAALVAQMNQDALQAHKRTLRGSQSAAG